MCINSCLILSTRLPGLYRSYHLKRMKKKFTWVLFFWIIVQYLLNCKKKFLLAISIISFCQMNGSKKIQKNYYTRRECMREIPYKNLGIIVIQNSIIAFVGIFGDFVGIFGTKALAKKGALGQISKNFQFYFIHINFWESKQKNVQYSHRVILRYCYICFSFLHCLVAQKNGNWKMAQGCPLSLTIDVN